PYFWLLDEPTSALDPEREAEVLKVVISLSREKKSLVIVTHNMNFARKVADRILFLDKGKIAFNGTPEQFFTSQNERIVNFISAMDI
ncbi:arginine ABC transporter ATP-binding protein ArtP, partial [Campylobacter hyointestinalis subsp. hyointestinalis]